MRFRILFLAFVVFVVLVGVPVGSASAQPPSGLLRVVTSPAVPSQVLVDGVPRHSWSLDWLKLPPGTYQVSFSGLEGFTTPQPQTVTVTDGETREVTGTFAPRGWLRVITEPPLPATISVDGIPRNEWAMWTDLVSGDYQVCFGDVTGYVTPTCQTATITAGTTTAITGTYN